LFTDLLKECSPMLTAIYLLCALGTLVLAGIGLHRLRIAPTLTLALIMPTLLAVSYDNLVIVLGRTLGEGPLLIALSWMRFMLHVLVLPPLLVAMLLLARGAGVRWVRHRIALIGTLILAAATFALGLRGEVLLLDLAPSYRNDILLYSHAHPSGPPAGAIMTLLGAIIYGGALALRARWPWIALAALYTLSVIVVPDPWLANALVNTGELLLLAALLRATYHFAAAPTSSLAPVVA
jgi:hypothetical protein